MGLEYLAVSCQERGTGRGSNGRRENHINGADNDDLREEGIREGEREGERNGEEEDGGDGDNEGSGRSRGRNCVGEYDDEDRKGGRQRDGQGQGDGQDSSESNFTVIDDIRRGLEVEVERERNRDRDGERDREKEKERETGWPGVSVPSLRGIVYFEGIGDIADIQAPLPRVQVRVEPEGEGWGGVCGVCMLCVQ